MDTLEDGGGLADVSGGGEAQAADKPGAHIGEDITVEVGHDHDTVTVLGGVLDDVEAGTIKKDIGELDVGELLGDILADAEEETIGHLHDVGLVDGGDVVTTLGPGILKGVPGASFTGLLGDELDALDDATDDLVLNATVLTLSVLTNEDGVDILVGGLVADDALAGSNIGKEVEGTTEGEVEGDVALANGGGQGTLEGNLVPVD